MRNDALGSAVAEKKKTKIKALLNEKGRRRSAALLLIELTLEVVWTDCPALVLTCALDGCREDLMDLLGHGRNQFTVAAESRSTNDIFDLGADDHDLPGLLL